jgi:DNA-binding transcriptional LysR family regulator
VQISHPGLAVAICEVPLTDTYGMLRKGDFDVLLQERPAREDDLGGGPALLVEERILVIRSAHPLSARHSVSLEDLADLPFSPSRASCRIIGWSTTSPSVHRPVSRSPAAPG